jgi:hypothetical protein
MYVCTYAVGHWENRNRLYYTTGIVLNPKNGTREDRASRQQNRIQFNNGVLQLALLLAEKGRLFLALSIK